jgi:hypothetical protein
MDTKLPHFYTSATVNTGSNKWAKSYIFWDVTTCSARKVNRRFGNKYRLHLQVRRLNQARDQHEAGSLQSIVMMTDELKMI